jgi:membrane protein required for colicin V production
MIGSWIGRMNVFDWILAAILILSTVSAFSRGIIRVLCSIGGLIAGVLIASWNYLSLAHSLRTWIRSSGVAQVVGFLLILIAVMLIFRLVAALLRKTVSVAGLGPLDRLLGAAFGVLRGCLVGMLVLGTAAFIDPESSWVRDSQLAPYFLSGAHALSFVVPQHFQRQIAQGTTHLLRRSPEYMKPHPLEWKHSD